MADYIPSSDQEFDEFQENYNEKVQAGPGTYGLDGSYAAALNPLSVDFHTKLGIAVNPATRTPMSIAAKDASEAALKSFIRTGVKIVQATVSVTNEAKEALRIPTHNNPPSPVPPPTSFPLIDATVAGPRKTQIKLHDSDTPTSNHKPPHVLGMAFFAKAVAAGSTPITDVNQLEFKGVITRTATKKEWSVGEAGKTVYMAGIWMTASGKIGPWSEIVSTPIAA